MAFVLEDATTPVELIVHDCLYTRALGRATYAVSWPQLSDRPLTPARCAPHRSSSLLSHRGAHRRTIRWFPSLVAKTPKKRKRRNRSVSSLFNCQLSTSLGFAAPRYQASILVLIRTQHHRCRDREPNGTPARRGTAEPGRQPARPHSFGSTSTPVQKPAPERYAREPGLAQVREPVQGLGRCRDRCGSRCRLGNPRRIRDDPRQRIRNHTLLYGPEHSAANQPEQSNDTNNRANDDGHVRLVSFIRLIRVRFLVLIVFIFGVHHGRIR